MSQQDSSLPQQDSSVSQQNTRWTHVLSYEESVSTEPRLAFGDLFKPCMCDVTLQDTALTDLFSQLHSLGFTTLINQLHWHKEHQSVIISCACWTIDHSIEVRYINHHDDNSTALFLPMLMHLSPDPQDTGSITFAGRTNTGVKPKAWCVQVFIDGIALRA